MNTAEMLERADALTAGINRLIDAHTDSLSTADAEAIATVAVAQSFGDAVLGFLRRHGAHAVSAEQLAETLRGAPWANVAAEALAKAVRPRGLGDE